MDVWSSSFDFFFVVFIKQLANSVFQSDHLQRKTWKVRWLRTFASTRKMKSERARLSQMQRSIAISLSMLCVVIGRFVQRLFVVFVCDLLGGLFFNKRLVVFVCVALRAASSENTRLVVFVCVALRAASILKNRVFSYLINVLQVSKYTYLGGFAHRECLRRLSFEK